MLWKIYRSTVVCRSWQLLLVAAVAMVVARPCDASILKLSVGATTITIVDGGAGDSNGAAGVITFIGSIGGWGINVSTGITYPALGSPALPQLDLNSVNVSSSGAGTLTISFSEKGFTGTFPLDFNVGGTTVGSVTAKSYADTSNVEFGTGTLLHSLGPYGPGAFSGSGVSVGPPGSLYSLTAVASITHSGAGATSFNAHLFVPEPGTIAIWSVLGMVGLAYSWKRRRVS